MRKKVGKETRTLSFARMTRLESLMPESLAQTLTFTSGRPSEKQMEMHFEGRHDPHQWQGLSFFQVYGVSSHGKL